MVSTKRHKVASNRVHILASSKVAITKAVISSKMEMDRMMSWRSWL